MPKYRVVGTVVGGKYLGEFEADSAELAEEMAMDEHGGNISLCHQCSGECEDGEVTAAHAELIESEPKEA